MRGNDSGNSGLSQFTKNRFFKGKLMTPSIMESAREYHSDRLHTLTRYIDGTGIVHGLEIRSIDETNDELEVTIESGLALDGFGRPIVVDQVTTKSLPEVSAEKIHLFIQYDEVAVETVPVPDTEAAIDEQAVPNRLLETFEITHRETPPTDQSERDPIDFSEVKNEVSDPNRVMQTLAEQYHQRRRTKSENNVDPAVYLGGFERTHEGNWVEIPDSPPRSYVYDHEMLFHLIAQHLVNADNSQNITQEDLKLPEREDTETLEKRLLNVEDSVNRLKKERNTYVELTLQKTIKDRRRFFNALSDRIEQADRDGSRLAREIARMSTDEFVSEDRIESAYRKQLEDIIDHLIKLGDSLEEEVTEQSLERFLVAVSTLQSALESETELIELIRTDTRVGEAADSLEVLVDVVSNT